MDFDLKCEGVHLQNNNKIPVTAIPQIHINLT